MATYIKIATVTVGAGGAASMDFTSISNAYTDLALKICARSSLAGINIPINLTFNNSSAANYNWKQLAGNGSSAGSSQSLSTTNMRLGYIPDTATTANTFGSVDAYIPNYLSSNAKSISSDAVQENNSAVAGETLAILIAGLWTLTSAINQITVFPTSGNLLQYSTATLYGISKS